MATDCLFKITIELKDPIERNGEWVTHINIPCGKCGRCIERRKMEWGFRMAVEMGISKTAYFVTLTYAPETVPYNKYGKKTLIPTRAIDLKIKKEAEGKKRINKRWIDRSFQGFIKRLRQNHKRANTKRTNTTIEGLMNGLTNKDKIKFYGAGEYGTEKFRPHYHAIIFNASEKTILKSWDLGGVHIVKANEATITYVMKYLDKLHNKEKDNSKQPEFNTMSEGIGESYIQRNKDWHLRNIDILYVTNEKGIRIPMPRYYREKIFSQADREEQIIIVNEILNEIRNEKIQAMGWHEFNASQNRLKRETEMRFQKKIKKRNID